MSSKLMILRKHAKILQIGFPSNLCQSKLLSQPSLAPSEELSWVSLWMFFLRGHAPLAPFNHLKKVATLDQRHILCHETIERKGGYADSMVSGFGSGVMVIWYRRLVV
ncbi:hypothetical protein Tco_0764722 [Tanacetum coccineum]